MTREERQEHNEGEYFFVHSKAFRLFSEMSPQLDKEMGNIAMLSGYHHITSHKLMQPVSFDSESLFLKVVF